MKKSPIVVSLTPTTRKSCGTDNISYQVPRTFFSKESCRFGKWKSHP